MVVIVTSSRMAAAGADDKHTASADTSPSNADTPQQQTQEQELERILLHDERSCIFETRVERAALCRDRGSQQFKLKNIAKAIEWYERAQYHVDFDEGTWHFEFMPKHRDAVNEVRLPVHLNLAMCFLSDGTQDLVKAVEQCEAALVIDPKNTKALYRCGRAHLLSNNLDGARTKLKLAAQGAPNDKSIREALQLLAEKTAEHRAKEKETWGGRLLETKAGPSSDSDNKDSSLIKDSKKTVDSTPSQTSSSSSVATPLLVLAVAVIAGLLLLLLK